LQYKNFIGGKWVESKTNKFFDIVNPVIKIIVWLTKIFQIGYLRASGKSTISY